MKMRKQFQEIIPDISGGEKVNSESPLVKGQALTGAELFRRQSSGLPVGCSVRQFDQVNPYLEKFSIYDNLSQYKMRHGMITNVDAPKPVKSAPNVDAPKPVKGAPIETSSEVVSE